VRDQLNRRHQSWLRRAQSSPLMTKNGTFESGRPGREAVHDLSAARCCGDDVAMELRGSCECGAIGFSVISEAPYPYRLCYCRRCRKIAGGGGVAINILADAKTLRVDGEVSPTVYSQRDSDLTTHFCPRCGSALGVQHPAWKAWVYPFASAIDTPLPAPPQRIHIQLETKPEWVPVLAGPNDQQFQGNTEESILDWHERLGLLSP
ncbi:MAG: GFA family protein, partial [Mycobacteriales bacterium]